MGTITPLNFFPFTVISPAMPCTTARMERALSLIK